MTTVSSRLLAAALGLISSLIIGSFGLLACTFKAGGGLNEVAVPLLGGALAIFIGRNSSHWLAMVTALAGSILPGYLAVDGLSRTIHSSWTFSAEDWIVLVGVLLACASVALRIGHRRERYPTGACENRSR